MNAPPPPKASSSHDDSTHLDHYPPASVKVIAETVGIENLSDEVARALAPDVEYRLREVIQDACKFMRHSKRAQLSTEDVNSSLRLRNVESLYGFPAGAGPIAFAEVPGQPGLFYQEQTEIELKDVLASKLPRPPVAVNVVPHWLAVEGVQPLIPENPAPLPTHSLRPDIHDLFRAPVVPAHVGGGGAGPGSVMQAVVAHELSKELQLYFDRITAVIRGAGAGIEAPLLRAALASLATDAGLHQLMPYFVQFVQEEVAKSLKNLARLRALVCTVHSLVSNPAIHAELYLHHLMPSVVTCMVAKRLSASPTEDHWSLRIQAAGTMALVCRKFGGAYPTIQPRITRTLLRAMLDAGKPLPTHFGAISGLSALGPRVVRLLILPNLKQYLEVLEPHMEPPPPLGSSSGGGGGGGGNERTVIDIGGGGGGGGDQPPLTEDDRAKHRAAMQRHVEACKTHDALKQAVGLCLHATLTAPQRAERDRVEPERRAERQRAAAAHAKASSELA
eukprot:CAMPEP_0181350554 /NCGR_PEP_ID=MMETSP1106-20121128/1324_1 /TAXON_ID=81844 /ORGANISM="Mantoniella antarctica, Strain SL-175" /LENGTH=503 /DNA_ID=CAMNT_0023463027 /DNA_START=148 /DNA_END=1656 /DNA_ORIENTATION=-